MTNFLLLLLPGRPNNTFKIPLRTAHITALILHSKFVLKNLHRQFHTSLMSILPQFIIIFDGHKKRI
jgi:hypothetical protein